MDLTHPVGVEVGGEHAVLGVERSLTGRRWTDRLDHAGHKTALAISQQLDIPDLLARVVAGRGIGVHGTADFLDPSLRALMPDPSALTDMDSAADRIAAAIRNKERIAIFGDYDVDGATSAALLARFLRWSGLDPLIHIPDRITEGYGPNVEAITALFEAGARLLVTVDCGSSSSEALDHARNLGMDTVVIDHHQIGETLPPARAVVNPNRQDDLSAQGHLAAVGVVFLVVVAVNRILRDSGWYASADAEPDLLIWLDLVALGTVADVVPLIGLNRAFVRKGLIVMRQRRFAGLSALADMARLTGPIDCHHLGFVLAPRINAGGRVGDAGLGVRLLLCDDQDEAASMSAMLERLNTERQEIEKQAVEEAVAQVDVTDAALERSVLVVHSNDGWHPGILGLVAARLKERYRRPAIAISFARDGTGSGSGRSIRGVDLGRAIREAVTEGVLLKGGGHAMAAGLTVARDRLAHLLDFLEVRLAGEVVASAVPEVRIDAVLTAGSARPGIVAALDKAGPYGVGNPEPVVALPAHRLSYAEKTPQGHLRCAFTAADGARIKAIAFRAAEEPLGAALLAGRNATFHVAGVLRLDRWGGREEVCLHLRDAARPGPR